MSADILINMRRFINVGLFGLLFISSSSYAFTCENTRTGESIGYTGASSINVSVDINPELGTGREIISDFSSFIVCRNDTNDLSVIDYLYTVRDGLTMFEGLAAFQSGLTINGRDNLTPISAMEVLQLGAGQRQPLPIQVFINVINKPSKPVSIIKGERLASLQLRQANNIPNYPDAVYTWHLIAANDATIITSSCTINHGQQINVNFGEIRSDYLTLSANNATIRQDKTLSYQCEDPVTQDIQVQLVGNAASFSGDALVTSNQQLGIVMLVNGQPVKPGDAFNTRMVNGSGSDTVTFIPVKQQAGPIATGEFYASATLVMTTA